MPVQRCQHNGRPGFRWGERGRCFTYAPGDQAGLERARERAAAQGRAIIAAQARRADQGPSRLFVQEYPEAVEALYGAALQRRVAAAHKLMASRLAKAYESLGDEINERARRDDAWRADQQTLEEITRRLLSVVNRTAATFTRRAPTGAATARRMANDMDAGATGALSAAIERVHGITVFQDPTLTSDMIDTWVEVNVALIKSIDDRYFADVTRVLRDGLETGRSTRDLTADVERRFQVSGSRARLIVRDQLGTLNAQLTEARQTELGIERYTWRSSEDDRVRATHEDFNGQVFTWAQGSPEGHPGEPIACRCTADPIIADPASLPTGPD